jgi:hypothetical protein
MNKNTSDLSEDAFRKGEANRPRPDSPSSAADTSNETFCEARTGQQGPGSPSQPADASDEIYQEGTTPVQAFTSPVFSPELEPEGRSRQGRPPRVAPARAPE